MAILAALFVGALIGYGVAILGGVAAVRDLRRQPAPRMCTMRLGGPEGPPCTHLAMPGHSLCRLHADCVPLAPSEARFTYVGGPWDGDVRAYGDPPTEVCTHGGVYDCDEAARAYIWHPA